MSYNGSGVFNINTSGQPVVTGTVISSTAFNALTADLATGLTTALTKDGQTTPTANIPMGGYKITGIAAATTLGDALSYGRAATVSTLTNSALTSGRVPYASTAGLLVDSASLTYDGTTLTATTGANFATSSGSVGIGTTSPSTKLEVAGAAKLTGTNLAIVPSTATNAAYVVATNTGGNFFLGIDTSTGASFGAGNYGRVLYSSAAYPMAFFTNDTERMRIDSSGNVGIGMTPTNFGNGYTVLQVANATNGGMLYLTNTSNVGGRIYGNTAGLTYEVFGALYQAFSTNSTERMRIDSSGNLLVGTTSAAGSRMVVDGATGGTAVLSTINSTGSGNQFGMSSSLGSTANNTNSAHFQGSTTSVGNWYLYGNGTNGFTSDRRLKKNIETTRDGYLEDICKLRVVKYNWKIDVDGTDKELGLIAQEVEQVFPKLVQDDLNRVSPDDETVYKTLKSSVIPFMLLKAIQELNARLTALESK